MAHSSRAGAEYTVVGTRRKMPGQGEKKPPDFAGRGLNPIQEGGIGGDGIRLSRRSIGHQQIYSRTHFEHFSDSLVLFSVINFL